MTRRAALLAGALGAGGLLAAQGGLGAAAALGAATPKRGGHLRVGHVGAGKGESFNPGRGTCPSISSDGGKNWSEQPMVEELKLVVQ